MAGYGEPGYHLPTWLVSLLTYVDLGGLCFNDILYSLQYLPGTSVARADHSAFHRTNLSEVPLNDSETVLRSLSTNPSSLNSLATYEVPTATSSGSASKHTRSTTLKQKGRILSIALALHSLGGRIAHHQNSIPTALQEGLLKVSTMRYGRLGQHRTLLISGTWPNSFCKRT
jgi:hypothetical protein